MPGPRRDPDARTDAADERAGSRWDWTGATEKRWEKGPNEELRPAKTLWDFLQLAIIPGILVLIALWFNASQASRDREFNAALAERDQERNDLRTREDRALALEARRDATLETYLSRMSDLMLDRKLLKSRAGSDVQAVARTVTLTTLRRLDGARKTDVVRFLIESHLIDTAPRQHPPPCAHRISQRRPIPRCVVDPLFTAVPKVRLHGADLRELRFTNVSQNGIDLAGADLRGATFDDALLDDVQLSGSDMRDASFRRANISGSALVEARLERAHFDDASIFPQLTEVSSRFVGKRRQPRMWLVRSNLDGTCLTDTSFVRATISHTRFQGADGVNTDFRRANLQGILTDDSTLRKANLDKAEGAPSAWARRSLGWAPAGQAPPYVPPILACDLTDTPPAP